MKMWKPDELAFIIITVTVCLVVVLSTIRPLVSGVPMGQETADVIGDVMFLLIGAVAGRISKPRDGEKS